MTTEVTPPRDRLLDADSATRKTYPMASGLLDYFPDALAYVAFVSYMGNQKHNPGEAMHHARGKSMDHADCIVRHVTRRGLFDGEVRETGSAAWRALALLQEELEEAYGLPLPRGARGERAPHAGLSVPLSGEIMPVTPKRGESVSEAICRTAREAHGLPRMQEQPPEWAPPVAPESKFGFTVGETVNQTCTSVGHLPGRVIGFDAKRVLVWWNHWQRVPVLEDADAYQPQQLRHGE